MFYHGHKIIYDISQEETKKNETVPIITYHSLIIIVIIYICFANSKHKT